MVAESTSVVQSGHRSLNAAWAASSWATRIGKSRMVTMRTLASPPESSMIQLDTVSATTSVASRPAHCA
jgi:hypothetical protein